MNNTVLESLNKIRDIESKSILNEATAAQIASTADTAKDAASLGQLGAQVGSKLAPAAGIGSKLAKFVPGLGLVAGGADAVRRAAAGDWGGAALSAGSGIASLVPGVGTAASIGLTAAQAARDKARTGSWMPDTGEIAAASGQDASAPATATQQVPPGGDPKVFALQQQLIAKGAKIKADGKMGPATQAAMKQFPDVKMAENNEETKMSESQKIAELMSRLAQFEQPAAQQVDEGPLDALKAGWSAAKTAGQNFMRGMSGQPARSAGGQFTKAGGATKAGQAIGQNKGKVGAAAGAAAGAAGMAALGGGAGNKPAPAAPAKPAAAAAPAAAPATAAPAALDPAEEQELALLAAELEKEMGRSPEVDNLLALHSKLRGGSEIPQP